MFAKRVDNLFIHVYDEEVWDEKSDFYYRPVYILHEDEDTFEENYLYYHGYIEAFNRVTDLNLRRIIERLLVKPKYTKFMLWQNKSIMMIAWKAEEKSSVFNINSKYSDNMTIKIRPVDPHFHRLGERLT